MTACALNLKKMVKVWDRKVEEFSIGKVISDFNETIRNIFRIFWAEFGFELP
jgi:hypothetical protein